MATESLAPAAALRRNNAFYNCNAKRFSRSRRGAAILHARKEFVGLIPRHGAILDVGCGSGRDSHAFLIRGFAVLGVDASKKMAELARRKGIQVRTVPLQSFSTKKRFDGIWASASLVHIPESELEKVLRRLARLLRPGGLMFVSLKRGPTRNARDDGRFFSYYSAERFARHVRSVPELRIKRKEIEVGSADRAAWVRFFLERCPAKWATGGRSKPA